MNGGTFTLGAMRASRLPLDQRINAFAQLGRLFFLFGESVEWPGHSCGLNEAEFAEFNDVVKRAYQRNGWFTEENVRYALNGLALMLDREALERWCAEYPTLHQQPTTNNQQPTIGIIMAGNVPLVGFHDLLCVLLSGNKARAKCSSDDAGLTAAVVSVLGRIAPDLAAQVSFAEQKLGDVDAVIATGSNNTARYFDHYFKHVPRIVRKSRTSIAVLDGSETDDELSALGEDVFRYFGLGCRNVGKLFVPRDFDLDRVFKALFSVAVDRAAQQVREQLRLPQSHLAAGPGAADRERFSLAERRGVAQ